MESRLTPVYFGPPASPLFGVFHSPGAPLRAAVLMCPPLLHEHMRSYRFFHQMAEQLAGSGLACLRFDYLGTGDSAGDDACHTPQQAAKDILLAASELRARAAGVPLLLLTIRGSALLATPLAHQLQADAIWLWQPVTHGEHYLQKLRERDRAERQSRYRYPLLRQQAPANPHDLMGFALSAEFSSQLGGLVLADTSVPVTLLDAPGNNEDWPAGARIDLPLSITAWSDEIDLTGLIPIRAATGALSRLTSECVPGGRHG
ncbi:hypothetical protein [Pseudoxanthomonas dokdonensis]|uniref:Serine aminopeptidase S33 domain-containing protein n=1 Tax=Pseudoxanthomonas dokdonensis TaxID=344882 RepID=A0A0R0CST1_9GAMM|nr:hypothetical protein [Pseudoxanthomonas dokdonensis]KRG68958.1 hypothetical protein ABB29_10920 [Pseudoxanthomonas dokdonensis]